MLILWHVFKYYRPELGKDIAQRISGNAPLLDLAEKFGYAVGNIIGSNLLVMGQKLVGLIVRIRTMELKLLPCH
jgi:hypothetical protein